MGGRDAQLCSPMAGWWIWGCGWLPGVDLPKLPSIYIFTFVLLFVLLFLVGQHRVFRITSVTLLPCDMTI